MDPCRLTIDVEFSPNLTVHFVGPDRAQIKTARALRKESYRFLTELGEVEEQAGDASKEETQAAIDALEERQDEYSERVGSFLKELCTGVTRKGEFYGGESAIQSAHDGGLFHGEDQAQLFERVCFRKWLEPSNNGAGRPGGTGEGQGSEEREGASTA